MAVVVLAGCGGNDEPRTGPAEAATSESTPAETETAYDPDDRDDFLLTGPSCEELSGWYEQFPADEDLDLLGAYIEECAALPQVAVDEPRTLLAFARAGRNSDTVAGMLAGPPDLREAATLALATRVCDRVDSGTKSLWQFQTELTRQYATNVKTSNAVLNRAAEACPENARLLNLFADVDYAAATDELRDYINTNFPTGPGAGANLPDDELAAMAQATCSGLADGDPLEEAGTLFAYFSGFESFGPDSGGAQLAGEAARRFCPQHLP